MFLSNVRQIEMLTVFDELYTSASAQTLAWGHKRYECGRQIAISTQNQRFSGKLAGDMDSFATCATPRAPEARVVVA